jgi:hypothetical protein
MELQGLRKRQRRGRGGHAKFFRLILSHESLFNYYQTNFNLMQHHKYSLTELENMLPWEREIYVMLLINHLEEENKRLQQQKKG